MDRSFARVGSRVWRRCWRLAATLIVTNFPVLEGIDYGLVVLRIHLFGKCMRNRICDGIDPARAKQILIPLLMGVLFVASSGCRRGGGPPPPRQELGGDGDVTIQADVWADNWFSVYLGDQLLLEDSVSIKTERSFNAESFSFRSDYPIVLNFVVRDFMENDSGLEYIGTGKQQMGDGGFIAQFKDAKTGELIAATDSRWKCYVLHRGPLDAACVSASNVVAGEGPCAFELKESPEDWMSADYSTDQWSDATEFSAGEVRPKDGYDRIQWDDAARLIWSRDLKKDNVLLFRIVIDSPDD